MTGIVPNVVFSARTARIVAAAGLVAALASPSVAQDRVAVDLELLLAVDVSASMDPDEFRLQRSGYVAAIRHPDFVNAILRGLHGRIALTYVEWSGSRLQHVAVPWTLIDGFDSADRFAADLASKEILSSSGTSISAALAFATLHFDNSPYEGLRRVIDISGDGPNNFGPPVTAARDAALARDITINGLPVMIRPSPIFPAMDRYYEDCVIGGPGAFTVSVYDADGFAEAIRRKLVVEVAGARPLAPVPIAGAPRVDCLVGERMRQRYLDPTYPGLAH